MLRAFTSTEKCTRSTYVVLVYLQLSKNYTSVTYLHLNHHREHTPGIPSFSPFKLRQIFKHIIHADVSSLAIYTCYSTNYSCRNHLRVFLHKRIHCLKQNLHAGAESSLDVMLRSFFMEKWFNLRPFVLLRRESKLIEDLHHRKHKYENTHQNYTPQTY